jgi:hypothetical protein
MIRTLAADLGFATFRSAVLAVATLAAIARAILVSPSLWGFALALAFLTGTQWDRQISCDGCGEALESRSE